MPILEQTVTRTELREKFCRIYTSMTKVVADVETGAMAIEGVMHADLERLLLESGSRQENLWGFNIYPEKSGDAFIEYVSLINIRPMQDNFSTEIEDTAIQAQVMKVVLRWVTDA